MTISHLSITGFTESITRAMRKSELVVAGMRTTQTI